MVVHQGAKILNQFQLNFHFAFISFDRVLTE